MRLYADVDTRQLITSPGIRQALGAVFQTRGDTSTVEIVFLRNGTQIDPTPDTVFFCVKPVGKFDTDPLVFSDTFTKSGTGATAIWTGSPSFNTTGLNEAFNKNSDDTDDISVLATSLEVGYVKSGQQTTIRAVRCNIENDLYRGGEAVPEEAVPPYPDTPAADTFLTGNSDGSAWQLRTVAETKTLLGLSGTTPGWDATVVTLTGGGITSLDGTDGVLDGSTVFTENRLFALNITGLGLKWAVLKAGTEATDGVSFVRCSNYADDTFEYVFNIIG